MKLIGMLDSPYVRRVAVSLELMNVPFQHAAISVFSTFEHFKSVNPVVKAPTLICDDGDMLMDSSLILQFIESTLPPGAPSLWPADPLARQHAFRVVSLALAACEKSVQIIYERNLRPAALQFEPWVERVTGQLLAAYAALEQEVAAGRAVDGQAGVTAAIAWQFTQAMLAAVVPASAHPALAALSAQFEDTPAFQKYPPVGPGV